MATSDGATQALACDADDDAMLVLLVMLMATMLRMLMLVLMLRVVHAVVVRACCMRGWHVVANINSRSMINISCTTHNA